MHGMASDYTRRVGVMLSAAMAFRDVTQADLARESGVPASTISRYETGETAQSAETMVQLAEALRLPIGLLLDHPSDTRTAALVRLAAWEEGLADEPAP